MGKVLEGEGFFFSVFKWELVHGGLENWTEI